MVDRRAANEIIARAMVMVRLRELLPDTPAPAPAIESNDERDAEFERLRGADGFRAFLPYWHFVNRESGKIQTFTELWPGQRDAVREMIAHPWLFALKAGKLGFTELACAWDAYRLMFAQPNARIGLFSKEKDAAKGLLKMVRFGLRRLPDWLRPTVYSGPGGDTTVSLILDYGPDDQRTLISYSTANGTAIDVTLTHAHIDELSHMLDPRAVWSSVSTTIAPEGTCHIVTRGAGDANYTHELFEAAQEGNSLLHPFFSPYDRRPDPAGKRDRDKLLGTMSALALAYYLPVTVEDAFASSDDSPYIPIERWDQLEHGLPPMRPGDRTPLVLALDAAVSNDCFAIVGVTLWGPNNRSGCLPRVFVV
jgi:hypothetical protein